MEEQIRKKSVKSFSRLLACAAAAAVMAFNIKTLVHAGGLYPGGATGLTILIQRICETMLGKEVSYSLINLSLNAIPIYIGFRFIGKQFTLYSMLMIFLTGIFTDMMPVIHITDDILLIAIFGGILNGTAISICLNMGFTSGGTDFISIYFSQKLDKDAFNLILGLNILILGAAGLLFGFDKALYSILFQYVSTQAIHTLYREFQKQTLHIVTDDPQPICDIISAETNHSSTILHAEGAYHHGPKYMVYSVLSGDEYRKVIRKIRKADPECFINSFTTDDISGNFYHKPTA